MPPSVISALGRRAGAQHRSVPVREQGPDPLLRRDRIRAQPVHPLSARRGFVGARKVRLRTEAQLWYIPLSPTHSRYPY